MTDATLLGISIGLLRSIVATIAGVLFVGAIGMQIHLSRRRRRDSPREPL